MPRNRRLLAIAALSLCPSRARAQEDEPAAVAVETIVITATRSQDGELATPWSVEVIDAGELEEQSYRTLPQALRDTTGVMVQETAQGQGSPYIRGFTGFNNLLLIDGVRLNNSVFRSGPNQYWNTVDPLSVRRIEVLKGPGSVLHGSDAVGGTVNVLTEGPEQWSAALGALLQYRFASGENSHVARIAAGGWPDESTGLHVGVTGKDFGNVRSGSGELPNTGYDEYDVDLKLEHRIDEDTTLTALHQRVRQNNVPRTHSTVFAVPFAGTEIGTDLERDLDQERELTYLALRRTDIAGFFDTFEGALSWHRQAEVRDRMRTGDRREKQGFDVGTLGVTGRLSSQDTAAGRFTVGAELYHDQVDSFFRDESPDPAEDIQGPVADDATYDLFGVYVQDEIPVGERLELTLGARIDHAAVDARSVRDPVTDERVSLEDDWTNTVGSARVLYALEEDELYVFGGVSQGFRAPNLSDLTRFDTARSDEFEIPARDLDPETFLGYELGLKAQSEVAEARVAVFYTDIRDAIVRVPTGETNADGDFEVTKANVGDGHVFGAEVEVAWELTSEWSVFGASTWLDGSQATFPTSDPEIAHEPLDRLMPWTSELGLRWQDEPRGLWAETRAVYADNADRLSTRDAGDTQRIPPGGTPSWFRWDVRAGWRVNEDLDLLVALENVLDENYRVHGSGVNAPGVNLVLGVTIGF